MAVLVSRYDPCFAVIVRIGVCDTKELAKWIKVQWVKRRCCTNSAAYSGSN
jgi:hypothetical protein